MKRQHDDRANLTLERLHDDLWKLSQEGFDPVGPQPSLETRFEELLDRLHADTTWLMVEAVADMLAGRGLPLSMEFQAFVQKLKAQFLVSEGIDASPAQAAKIAIAAPIRAFLERVRQHMEALH